MFAAPFSLPSSRPSRSFPPRNDSLIYPISVSLLKKQVTVKIQVRQQRRDHSSLRCPLTVALTQQRTSTTSLCPFHYRYLKPHTNQLKHRAVRYPHPHTRQKPLMRNRIKVPFKVGVVHRLISESDQPANLLQRLARISLRAKPVGTCLKVRLKDRLQNQ